MKRMPTQPETNAWGEDSIQPIDPGIAFAREAARVDRLTADRELVDRMMWHGYVGTEWELFRTALAEYGVAVMAGWIRSGRIFIECRRKGFGAIAKRKRAATEEALGLAGETVAHALLFFRNHVLIPGRWDVAKGATLKTFFVGACIHHFPNVYARSDGSMPLLHALRTESDAADDPLSSIGDPSPFSRPDRQVELKDAVESIEDPVIREIFLDEARGFTQGETALRLKTTRWAIEGRLRRYREKAVHENDR